LLRLLALLALAPACATNPTTTIEAPASELSAVPFFPQDRYQCGPAALATVLVERGVNITPEALVPEVYLPERRGSLQLELVAATRRHGRVPYPLAQDTAQLLEEVAAGAPVLVLQNLGLAWLPQWHYAVVIGYDPAARMVLLRSGRKARRQESLARFDRSWALADRWALRILQPGETPATGQPDTYLRGVVNSRQTLPPEDMARALEAGVKRWPGDADLAFAAGNQARTTGALDRARDYYERALAADAEHPGVLNNLADLLLALGEVEQARMLIERALTVTPEGSALRPVLEATKREVEEKR
jgi:tetratricopeptide (TPR) repeat protein